VEKHYRIAVLWRGGFAKPPASRKLRRTIAFTASFEELAATWHSCPSRRFYADDPRRRGARAAFWRLMESSCGSIRSHEGQTRTVLDEMFA